MSTVIERLDAPKSRRRRFGDWMIRVGLFMQLLFLALVDWGTIAGMLKQPDGVPTLHIVGLAVTNAVLLVATYVGWVWMRRVQANEPAHE